ncbi:hypothetical protein EC845_4189 [Comamonas sp. BIGb0124]|nr:hypothetical protein EC845_4189 [Comamonas sp. BIGb0124]
MTSLGRLKAWFLRVIRSAPMQQSDDKPYKHRLW